MKLGKKNKEENIEIEIVDVKKERKKRKFSIFDLIRYMVMLAALCLFSYAAYQLTLIYITAEETEELKGEVEDLMIVPVDDKEYYNAKGEKIYLSTDGQGKAFVWDPEKLKEVNPYAKGYILQKTGDYINDPIVQHPTDNNYYLYHLANNMSSGVGAVFIDTRIKDGLYAKNCVLYGHNVKAWAHYIRFGSLNFYYDDENYGKKNPTMDVYIDEHHYVYYVYSIFKVVALESPVYTWDFKDNQEFLDYANEWKSKTLYEFPDAPEITADSHILTLSTCTVEHEERMIVQLVRGEEVFDVPVKGDKEEDANEDEEAYDAIKNENFDDLQNQQN